MVKTDPVKKTVRLIEGEKCMKRRLFVPVLAAVLSAMTFFATVKHGFADASTGCPVCTPDGCNPLPPGEYLYSEGVINHLSTCVSFSGTPPGHCGDTERQERQIFDANHNWIGNCYLEICDAVVADPNNPCERAYHPGGPNVISNPTANSAGCPANQGG